MIKEKLVLAYSGGLDTSYSLKKLSQENYEVHAVSVNTGGFSKQEIDTIEKKAYEIGAHTYKNINALKSYYNKIVRYLLCKFRQFVSFTTNSRGNYNYFIFFF